MTDSEEVIEEIVHIPTRTFNKSTQWNDDRIYYLEGILTYKESITNAPAALISGPHPNFAGTMDNNVTLHLSKELAEAGWITLRFNYPGIGGSDLNMDWVQRKGLAPSSWEYWNYVEKELEFDLAEQSVLSSHLFLLNRLGNSINRLIWIGYSFGALISLRLSCTQPDSDMSKATPDNVIALSTPWLAKHKFDFIRNLHTPTLAISGDHDFTLDKTTLNYVMENIGEENPLTLKILENQDHFFRGSENLLISEIHSWLQ